jgi:putative membrane protein
MNLKKRFTDSDLDRIKAAVNKAEDTISGEIVPVIVERSGYYSIANYKGGILGASITFFVMVLLDRYILTDAENGLFYDPVFIFFLATVGGMLGALLPSIFSPLKRILVSRQHLDNATKQRAESAFLQEEVFNTKQRTGIMIFISFFEREVMVVADKGISKVVEQKVWDKMVTDLVTSIRNEKIVEGLEASIKKCGEILFENGFLKAEDDVNELSDDLRID